MNVLYIYPEPGIPYTIHEIWKGANDTLPDTLLMGANRLPEHEFDVEYFDPSDYSLFGQPPRFHARQQWEAIRKISRYDVVACKDLRTGILLGYLRRVGLIQTPLVLLDLVLSEDTPLQSVLRHALLGFDRIVCATPRMLEYAESRLGLPNSKLMLIPWAIDLDFWSVPPDPVETERNLIVSCGSKHRDFETLIDAVEGTRFHLEIITSSEVPDHPQVTQSTYHPVELRNRYLKAEFVVLALYDVPSASGITSFLESLAMNTPVIITDSSGIRSFIQHNHNSISVQPRSSSAIVDAVEKLEDEQLYRQLKVNGRDYVESHHDIDDLSETLSSVYSQLSKEKIPGV